ncbi:MAG: hypothetical protein ACOYL6_05225 [Bacteriovoracaceae bacterium]
MSEQFYSVAKPVNTHWIEELAIEEINMEESGVVQFNNHLNPLHLLEESSLQFMESLRDRFEIYLTKFNMLRSKKDNTSSIKIFKISNTINDFMLFRNALKLVVARRSPEIISIAFLSHSGGLFAARMTYDSPSVNTTHEIRAHVGPFNNITWRFNGETVDVDQLVKHYLIEFIKHSAR